MLTDTAAVTRDDRPFAQALRYLSGLDEDHAREKNDAGFNRIDGEFGHSLAEQSLTRPLTDRQAGYAQKMLSKYRAQLEAAGFKMADILAPVNPPVTTATVGTAAPQKTAKQPTNTITRNAGTGNLEINFRYDPSLVDLVKTIPGRQFINDVENKRKYWQVPAESANYAVRMLQSRGFDVAADVLTLSKQQEERLAALNAVTWQPGQLPLSAAPVSEPTDPKTVKGSFEPSGAKNTVIIKTGGYHPELVKIIHTISGAEWSKSHNHWRIPADMLEDARTKLDWFTVNPELIKQIEAEKAAAAARIQENEARIARFMAATNNLTDPLPGNPEIRLYEHQREAILFALRSGKALYAMDMGTGKTLAALNTARAYEGIEVIVVCPVSLKANWQREAKWSGVTISVHSWHHNTIPDAPPWPFIVIGDEVHRAKNPKALRTQKFMSLCEHKNCVGTLLLTGTPMVNGRPAELMPMLRMLDHPVARNQKQYERRYCDAHHNGFAYDKNGAAHLDELREKTKDVIFRKRKEECLDLPEKVRVQYEVEITKEAKQVYDEALRQMKRAYEERKAKGEINAADALAMLQFVRHAAALGTIESVIEGAKEILAEGRQVLLFTNFKDVAATVASALDAEILSGDVPPVKRDPMVQRFQNGERKAMVLTYGAGGVGITLTAASYVYLIDRPWTPGECTQAEDRAHRNGQKNSVTVVWPQAFEINHNIDAVLLEKQENIDTFLDEGAVDTLAAESMSGAKIALHVLRSMMGEE